MTCLDKSLIISNVPVKSKLQYPPRSTPRAFEFFEKFCSNSPLTGPKSCSNPPTPGKISDYFFNFSVASIMLLRLYMLTWFIILDYTYLYTGIIDINRSHTPSNTERSLCGPLVFKQWAIPENIHTYTTDGF